MESEARHTPPGRETPALREKLRGRVPWVRERENPGPRKKSKTEIPGPREKKARAARESPRSGEKPHGRERNPGLCYIGPERKSKVVRKNPWPRKIV